LDRKKLKTNNYPPITILVISTERRMSDEKSHERSYKVVASFWLMVVGSFVLNLKGIVAELRSCRIGLKQLRTTK